MLSGIEIKLASGTSDTNFTVQVPLGIPQFNGVRATTTVTSDNAAGAQFNGLDAQIKLFNVPGAGDKLQAPFTSLNGHLRFTLSTKTWDVSLSFSVPGVGSIAESTKIDDGKLSELAVSGTYDNPGIALGDSGAFLQSVSARFAHNPHYSQPKIGVIETVPVPAVCAQASAPKGLCDSVRAQAAARVAVCKDINDYYDQWIALKKAFPGYCGKVGEISFDPPVEVDGSVGIAAGPVLAGTAALIATGTLRYVDSYFDGTNKVPWAFDVEGSLELGGLPFDKKTLDPPPPESKFSKFHPINHSGLKAWLSLYGDGKVQAGGGFDYKLPRSTDNWLLSITGSAAVSLLPKGAAIGRPSPGATPQQYASVVQAHVKNWTIAGTITGQICAQIPTVVKGCATGAAGISNNGVAGCASFELPGSTVLQSIAQNGAKAINAVARFGRDAGEKLKGVFAVLKQKAQEAESNTKRFVDKVGAGVVNIVNKVGDGFKSLGNTISGWFHFAPDPSASSAANEVVNENVRIPNVNFAIGAAYRWSDHSTVPITSCSHDQLLLALSARDLARAAAAGLGSAQVTTHGERPAPRMFVLKGVTAAPDVLVMGPDDRTIRTSGPGFAEPGWIVYKDPAIRTTYVDVVDAPRVAGTSSPLRARHGSRRSRQRRRIDPDGQGRDHARQASPVRDRLPDPGRASRRQGEAGGERRFRGRAHVRDAARPPGDRHVRARADAAVVPARGARTRHKGLDERRVAGAHRREPVGARQAATVTSGRRPATLSPATSPAAERSEPNRLGADAAVAPRLERRRGDGEVLDREAGRVEQRHGLGPGSPGRVAGQHRTELADAPAVNEPSLDRPGQLTAV